MKKRVVITGLGVCAPNGIGLKAFTHSIKNGVSGVRFYQELADLNFGCHIAGQPEIPDGLLEKYFTPLQLRDIEATGIKYGMIAGIDAWQDAGLTATDSETVDYDSGVTFGTSLLGADRFRKAIHSTDAGKVKRLGSTTVIQTMASGISAYLGGYLGCGNQVTTNSSACTTGTESILMGYDRIVSGSAKRMLVGGCNDSGPYIWGGFDAMRVLTKKFNDAPDKGSRPMQSDSSGFVPGSGAGALVLESLESALSRNAIIYAEILGGHINSGGQRQNGSMTAPNSEAVQKCIKNALKAANIKGSDVDTINGHLTSTGMCPVEVTNWVAALDRKGDDFPYINSLKSMTGHCLAAAGSIESVASVLQIRDQFIFGNINNESIHEDIVSVVSEDKIPGKTFNHPINIVAKASFGFGDVNGCIIYKRFNN